MDLLLNFPFFCFLLLLPLLVLFQFNSNDLNCIVSFFFGFPSSFLLLLSSIFFFSFGHPSPKQHLHVAGIPQRVGVPSCIHLWRREPTDRSHVPLHLHVDRADWDDQCTYYCRTEPTSFVDPRRERTARGYDDSGTVWLRRWLQRYVHFFPLASIFFPRLFFYYISFLIYYIHFLLHTRM